MNTKTMAAVCPKCVTRADIGLEIRARSESRILAAIAAIQYRRWASWKNRKRNLVAQFDDSEMNLGSIFDEESVSIGFMSI